MVPFSSITLVPNYSAIHIGDRITGLALPLTAILLLHARPAEMGYLTAAGLLPFLLLSLPVGVWLDRRGRRRSLMILSDIGRMLLLLSIPAAFITGWLTLIQLYIVVGVVGVMQVVFDLAYPSVVTTVVGPDDYLSASTLLQGSRAVSQLVGPGLAGYLVEVLTAPIALVVDAASFVVSAIGLATMATKQEEPVTLAEPKDVTEGLRFVWASAPARLILIALSIANFFNYIFSTLYVLYATRSLHIHPAMLGLIFSVGAIGTALGAIVAAPLARKLGTGNVLAIGVALFTVPLILVPLAGGHRIDIIGFLVIAELGSGFGVMLLDISFASMALSLIPNAIRSRANGAFTFINYGVRPIGALAGGWLPGLVGIHGTLWLATVGACFSGLWLLPKVVRTVREPIVQPNTPNVENG